MQNIFFILIFASLSSHATLKKYRFDINVKKVNITGKEVEAIAIDGQIPAPLIEATVGDILQVTFNNKMSQSTSVHWHGVLLPNDQDGVPHLTTKPIAPHSSFTYRFKVKHTGTYWYHSHTGLQEQRGVYGPLVFRPKRPRVRTNYDQVVVLSDWTNENPKQVLANIKKDGHYYALKKGSVISWFGVLKNGSQAIKNKFINALFRMEGMDLSDIGYDAFLINGKKQSSLTVKPRQRVRLRLINSSASTYFNVEFSGQPLQVISADGMDVESFFVKRLQMAIAETYDVIISIPDRKLYELRATANDGTGYGSLFIGFGNKKVLAPIIEKPNLYLMKHHKMKHSKMKHSKMKHSKMKHSKMKHSKMKHSKMKHHKMKHHMISKKDNKKINHSKVSSPIEYMTDYKNVRALKNTNFRSDRPKRKVHLDLTGNMERYIWSFNNKTLLESDKIFIKKGEIVQFTLNNTTMMSHPLHLHGHFFRVLNGQGKRSPLKHTVNVPAMQKIIIEFEANEEKDWFFHCHNLYHMKTGMSRVVSYKKTSLDRPLLFKKISSDPFYFMSEITLLSQMTEGFFKASSVRNIFEVEYDWNYKDHYEVELNYIRNLTRFADVYLGTEIGQKDFFIGFRYLLPFLIESDFRTNFKGLKLELESDIQLTSRFNLDWSYSLESLEFSSDLDQEYRASLSYELNKQILVIGNYDSDFKWGVGIQFKF